MDCSLNNDIRKAAGVVAVVCCTVQVVFQFGLAVGMPWGAAAYGGGSVNLSKGMRISSAVAVIVYAGMATVLLQRAELRDFGYTHCRRVTRFFTGLMFVGTILNSITPSQVERQIWAPFCLIFFISLFTLSLETSQERRSRLAGNGLSENNQLVEPTGSLK